MLGFLVGLMAGGLIGVIIMALMNVASDADRHSDNIGE